LVNLFVLVGAKTLSRLRNTLSFELFHPGLPDGLSRVGPDVWVHTNRPSTVGDPTDPTTPNPFPRSILDFGHGRWRGRRERLRGLRESLVERRRHWVGLDALLLVPCFEREARDRTQRRLNFFDTVNGGKLRINVHGVGVYSNVLQFTNQVITCPLSARLLKVS
jgi:hypothetical protein